MRRVDAMTLQDGVTMTDDGRQSLDHCDANALRLAIRIARDRAICVPCDQPSDVPHAPAVGFPSHGRLPHGRPLFLDGSTQCARCHRLVLRYDDLLAGWCATCAALASPRHVETRARRLAAIAARRRARAEPHHDHA